MTIDTSGKWWVGDAPEDIEAYLKELKPEGYEIDRFKLARCACGVSAFLLDIDDEEGAAKHACATCKTVGFIGDSDHYFATATQSFSCECGNGECNVGVGFSLYEPDKSFDVRWLSVGVRCTRCGILGCIVDWKVGGGNDADFLNKV